MNWKIKRLLEDILILIVLILIVSVGYSIYSNLASEETPTLSKTVVDKPIDIIEETQEEPQIIVTPVVGDEKEHIEEVIKEEKVVVSQETRNKLLKDLIDTIEEKITKNIQYLEDKEEKNVLNIRITILQNGDFEQLTFIDGNEKLFQHNKNNITKIFPVKIDKAIIDEFPRYIRMKLEKK